MTLNDLLEERTELADEKNALIEKLTDLKAQRVDGTITFAEWEDFRGPHVRELQALEAGLREVNIEIKDEMRHEVDPDMGTEFLDMAIRFLMNRGWTVTGPEEDG